jgi:hypothetical protein
LQTPSWFHLPSEVSWYIVLTKWKRCWCCLAWGLKCDWVAESKAILLRCRIWGRGIVVNAFLCSFSFPTEQKDEWLCCDLKLITDLTSSLN